MRFILIGLLFGGMAASAETPGEALFLRGEGAQAIIGGGTVRLPADRFACAGCHGADGSGRAEGGTTFPAIQWSALTHQTVPYDMSTVRRALREGIGADGRALGAAMPRYDAPSDVLDSLIAYLQRLQLADTGLLPDSIRVSPSGNPALDMGFAAAAERVNASGGAFGRKLEFTADGSGIPLALLADETSSRLAEACIAASLTAMQQAGVTEFALLGGTQTDISYRANGIGLSLNPEAKAVLALDAPENAKAGQHYYGCIDVLGPVVDLLTEQRARVRIALPDRAAFDWARQNGYDWQAMRGYTLGGLLGQAARNSGRRTTSQKLIESTRSLPVAIETITLP